MFRFRQLVFNDIEMKVSHLPPEFTHTLGAKAKIEELLDFCEKHKDQGLNPEQLKQVQESIANLGQLGESLIETFQWEDESDLERDLNRSRYSTIQSWENADSLLKSTPFDLQEAL
jgi:hypothetical protein